MKLYLYHWKNLKTGETGYDIKGFESADQAEIQLDHWSSNELEFELPSQDGIPIPAAVVRGKGVRELCDHWPLFLTPDVPWVSDPLSQWRHVFDQNGCHLDESPLPPRTPPIREIDGVPLDRLYIVSGSMVASNENKVCVVEADSFDEAMDVLNGERRKGPIPNIIFGRGGITIEEAIRGRLIAVNYSPPISPEDDGPSVITIYPGGSEP